MFFKLWTSYLVAEWKLWPSSLCLHPTTKWLPDIHVGSSTVKSWVPSFLVDFTPPPSFWGGGGSLWVEGALYFAGGSFLFTGLCSYSQQEVNNCYFHTVLQSPEMHCSECSYQQQTQQGRQEDLPLLQTIRELPSVSEYLAKSSGLKNCTRVHGTRVVPC